MIDFEIDIEKPTPYKEVLVSLIEQSHALQTIHNPKTWCLSALTYALHLNDCLVLFSDLKERWKQSLPFDEAWDVDLRQWRSDIWSAAINTDSATKQWESLCDTDYGRFLDLSRQFIEGEIPLTPLLDFVKGKNSNLSQIIQDVARKLIALFGEIEQMLVSCETDLFADFYDGCIEGYAETHSDNLYFINTKTDAQPYDTWKASKTAKALPAAIEKQIATEVKEISENKTWGELWEENYNLESREIDHEGIARYVFMNRSTIISNKQYPYKQSLDKLFYSISMVEYLSEQLKSLGPIASSVPTPEEIEKKLAHSNTVFKATIGTRDISFTKLHQFIKENCVDNLGFKYEWYGLYLFAYKNTLLQDTNLQNFAAQMNQAEWFGYLDDRKHCTADSMGDYNFILDLPESRWNESSIPTGSKASKSGLNKVLRMYNNLAIEYNENRVCGAAVNHRMV